MFTFKLNTILLFLYTIIKVAYPEKCPPPETVEPCSCHDKEDDVDVTLYCSNKETTLRQIRKSLKTLKGQKKIGIELEGLNLGILPSDFFKGFNVKYLQISHCNLDSLDGGGGKSLDGLEDTLEKLVISSSFSEDNQPAKLAVSHLRKLKELDLTYNIITELNNDWFKNASPSLRRLMISNNGIQKIGDRAFADIVNLEYLALDGNRFGPVSRNMLPNPANELDTLELDNNALTSLPEDLFINMPYIKEISLATNGLTHLYENTWKRIWNQLDDVDLRGNPLECDSHMDWMSQIPTCADVSGTCLSPHRMIGKNIPFVRDENCVYH